MVTARNEAASDQPGVSLHVVDDDRALGRRNCAGDRAHPAEEVDERPLRVHGIDQARYLRSEADLVAHIANAGTCRDWYHRTAFLRASRERSLLRTRNRGCMLP